MIDGIIWKIVFLLILPGKKKYKAVAVILQLEAQPIGSQVILQVLGPFLRITPAEVPFEAAVPYLVSK